MHISSRAIKAVAIGVGLAVAASLSLVATASAGPPAAASGSTDISSGAVTISKEARAAGLQAIGAAATDQQALDAYWTPERMRSAIPADDEQSFQKSANKFVQTQETNIRLGIKPTTNDGPLRQVKSAPSKVFSGNSAGTNAFNPNLPYYVPTAYTAGKVFFNVGSQRFQCSGTIINSEGRDTVWTAGHCVHGGSGGTWKENWAFVPAYDDDLANPRPYGTWTANALWSKSAWVNSSDFSQDMGVAIMNTNFGYHIVDYFGGQGLTTNRGKNVYEYAFGYPAEAPFDGGNLMRCQGTTSPEWDAWLTWSQTVKIPCDMTRGSSGGGWLYGYNGNWGSLNGVNSRIDRIVGPTIMLSPYFDDDAWGLYNTTRNL